MAGTVTGTFTSTGLTLSTWRFQFPQTPPFSDLIFWTPTDPIEGPDIVSSNDTATFFIEDAPSIIDLHIDWVAGRYNVIARDVDILRESGTITYTRVPEPLSALLGLVILAGYDGWQQRRCTWLQGR